MVQSAPLISAFAPGSRICVRDEEWIVSRAEPIGGGEHAIACVGVSELVAGYEAIFHSDLEGRIQAVTAENTELVSDVSPQHRRSKLYIESLIRRSALSGAELVIGHTGVMREAAYQLVPAAKALRQLRPRLLIGDAVGLGKTIEVGVLLSELIARGRGQRILVVVMKSMLTQFQKELWTRFTIPLIRLDSVGLKRVEAKIPAGKNPFHHYKRVIISIDTLKNDRQYRSWLEKCHWDAVVVDECHNAVNIGTGRHRVTQLLSSTSDAFILTSATPHNGRRESFANLINMLDPTAIADVQKYGKDDIQQFFVRRFKKDIAQEAGDNFPQRDLKIMWAQATVQENKLLQAIEQADLGRLNRRVHLRQGDRGHDILYKTTLLKSLLSSPQALSETLAARIRQLQKAKTESASAAFDADLSTLASLSQAARDVIETGSSKLTYLFEHVLPELGIEGKPSDPRIVVFSERLATLEVLRKEFHQRLGIEENKGDAAAGRLAVITGSESDLTIAAVLDSFGSLDGKVRVLLASDMASEGINLHHHCHLLVHYDVPWSFIRLEQRNGRIDRYGQEHTPVIRYLLTKTAEAEVAADIAIIEALIRKAQAARDNLGDEGAVLGLYDPVLEEQGIASAIGARQSLENMIRETKADCGDSQDWLLDGLFGESAAGETTVATGARPTLFCGDLDYFLQAAAELKPLLNEEGGTFDVDVHPSRPELELSVPSDLRRYLEELPPQARPSSNGGRMLLTTDRPAVERSIAESRKREDTWPQLQLLWPHHPAMEWARDRLVVTYGRQQAPILIVPRLADVYDKADAMAIIQATLSNKRGQAVVVEWFGLPTYLKRSKKTGEPLPLVDVIDQLDLRGKTPNPRNASVLLDKLNDLRADWTNAAQEHMTALREARRAALIAELKTSHAKLQRWKNAGLERLGAQEAGIRASQMPAGLKKKRLQRNADEKAHIERMALERKTWIEATLATDERAHVKLVAVIASK